MNQNNSTIYAAKIRDQQGSAMVIVIVMITTLTLFMGVVLLGDVLSNRLIHRNYNALQAFYAAESGLEKTMWLLAGNDDKDLSWRTQCETIDLFTRSVDQNQDMISAVVQVRDWGGYLRIQSTATYRGKTSAVAALIGQRMPPAFQPAVTIGKSEYALVATGNTRIFGNVTAGKQGVRTEWIKGKPYTGGKPVSGEIIKQEKPEMPPFDTALFEQVVLSYKNSLNTPQGQQIFDNVQVREAEDLPGTTIFIHGNLAIDLFDVNYPITGPKRIIATGSINISRRSVLRGDIELIAGEKLSITDRAEIGQCILYAEQGIALDRNARSAAQMFSPAYIKFSERARMSYPGIAFCSAEPQEKNQPSGVLIEDRAQVQGAVIATTLSQMDSTQSHSTGKIVVSKNTTVEGAIYCRGSVNLQGRLLGSVVTEEFELYLTPTRYQNYLYNARIDRRELPDDFLLPVGFSTTPQLEVLSRRQPELTKEQVVTHVQN